MNELALAERLLRLAAPEDGPRPGSILWTETRRIVAEHLAAMADAGIPLPSIGTKMGRRQRMATRLLFKQIARRAAQDAAKRFEVEGSAQDG